MLYTIKKSFATHQIEIDNYLLYFEEYGNPNGIPIIFLHGGPGSGCSDSQKALFNYKKFRVVFLDQRGAGRSSPKGSLEKNTTDDIINDLEIIRKYLKIEKWLVVGGSWGATLGIAYAEINPDKILGLVLRAVFLGTEEEVNWAFYKAAYNFKPKMLYELNSFISIKLDSNPVYKLGKMLESQDPEQFCLAAELWQEYERCLSSIDIKDYNFSKIYKNIDFSHQRVKRLPNTPFLEWHYIKNNFFFRKNQLMKNKAILKNIPITFIQGNYDLLCPPSNSFLFSQGLPKLKIYYANLAGHYISDPKIKETMVKAIDEFDSI